MGLYEASTGICKFEDEMAIIVKQMIEFSTAETTMTL
jgi:hypothetical protein